MFAPTCFGPIGPSSGSVCWALLKLQYCGIDQWRYIVIWYAGLWQQVFQAVMCVLCVVVCFPGVTTHCGCIFHSPVAGFSLLEFEVSWSHTTTRHSRWDSSGRVINPSQRPLPDNTQHLQQTNIHVPSGIRTHNLSRWAAEDLPLRPRGHWDRLIYIYICIRLRKLIDM